MDNPSILSHASVGVSDYPKAIEFYTAVLATIGAVPLYEYPDATGFGKKFPEFWVQLPIDGNPKTVGNGTHFGFTAPSKEAVNEFWKAALKHGATGDGEPGPRPHYGEPYYGCFVKDLDGHKIEATFWDDTLVSD